MSVGAAEGVRDEAWVWGKSVSAGKLGASEDGARKGDNDGGQQGEGREPMVNDGEG